MSTILKVLLVVIGFFFSVAQAKTNELITIDPDGQKVEIIDTFGDQILTSRGVLPLNSLTKEVPELNGFRKGVVVLDPSGFRRIVFRVFADGRVSLVVFLNGQVTGSMYRVPFMEEIFSGNIDDLRISTACNELMLPPFEFVPAGFPPLQNLESLASPLLTPSSTMPD